jgi:uncharacterized protein DUF5317
MIWLGALVLGLVAGLLTGGSVDNFARIKFRWPLIVLAGVAVREIVLLTPFGRVEGAEYVYVAALAAIVAWTILHFDRLPGIWFVTAGGLLNLTVILANGGRMPVAADLAGPLLSRGTIGQYTLMGAGTNLSFLGDWISIGPVREAYSPGDLAIALGIALVVFLGVRSAKVVTQTDIGS